MNVMPYAEPFEMTPPYTNGFPIDGTNGWVGIKGSALITSNEFLVTALDDFLTNGIPLPLPGPHTKVLCVTPDEFIRGRLDIPRIIANKVNGNTQKVFTDLLWWPRLGAQPRTVTTNDQVAFYPDVNGTLAIWHDDSGTPKWHPLLGDNTNTPGDLVISTGQWIRVTIEQNFTHSRWRIRFNGQQHVADPKGWNTASGSIHPGVWFDMVNRGSLMNRIEFEGESCIDDLVVQSSNPFPGALHLIIR
jgi:hypothetical protein